MGEWDGKAIPGEEDAEVKAGWLHGKTEVWKT